MSVYSDAPCSLSSNIESLLSCRLTFEFFNTLPTSMRELNGSSSTHVQERHVIFVSRHSQTSVGFGGKPDDSFYAVGVDHREPRAGLGTTPLPLPATRTVVRSGRDGYTAGDS